LRSCRTANVHLLSFKSVLQRQQRLKLSNWDCEYQLFRKELEDADDLRLSVRMFHACLADKKQFCDDVPAGGNSGCGTSVRSERGDLVMMLHCMRLCI
jgi:hypothetical protein